MPSIDRNLSHTCERMLDAIDEYAVVYWDEFRLHAIEVPGESVMFEVYYCPFCGCPLPSSLKNRWFGELERISTESSYVPLEIRTRDRWQ